MSKPEHSKNVSALILCKIYLKLLVFGYKMWSYQDDNIYTFKLRVSVVCRAVALFGHSDGKNKPIQMLFADNSKYEKW